MRFLLDTNVVIAANKAHPGILARLEQYGEAQCVVSEFVIHELYFGAFKSERSVENL